MIDRVYGHPVNASIVNMLNELDQIKERRHYDDIPADEYIQHAEYVLKYIQNKLACVDPLLVSITTLNTIDQLISQIQSQINNFVSTANVGHLHNIDTQLISILQQQSGIFTPQNLEDLTSLKEAITGFKRSFGQHISHASKQVESLTEKADQSLQGITKQVSELKKQTEDTVSNFLADVDTLKEEYTRGREQFVADLTTSEQKLRDQLEEIDQETREKITNWDENLSALKNQINELVESQMEVFAATLETSATAMQDSTENGIKAFEERVTTLIDTEKNKLDELWKHLEKKKSEVEELAGSVSITSMAGFYKGIADREKSSENLWKWISTIVFVLLIGVTSYNAYSNTDDFTWAKFAPKIPVSIAFGSFLAFCLRQLTVHRKHERYNRQTQLELSALEPYITTLGPEVSKDIKSKLAEKLFGRADQMMGVSSADDKPEIMSQEAMLNLLDKVGTIVKGK